MSDERTSRKYIWIPIVVIAIFVTVIVLSFVFYGRALRAQRGQEEVVDVTFRLNWQPDPTFTGAFMAKIRGTWAKRDVNVEILAGGMNISPERLVSEGRDDFGVIGANRLIQARSQGYPLVAVCAEMQTHPVGWIVREDSEIRSFSDFEGKRIGLKVGDESETIMDAVFNKVGLSRDRVTLVPVGFSPEPLLTKQVDALPVYINEEPHTVAAKGVKVRIIHPSDVGITLYGNVIVTHENTVKTKSSLVQRFVSGLLEGWEEAKNANSKTVATELINADSRMGDVATEKVVVSTLDLVYGSAINSRRKLGWMDLEGWQRSESVMRNYAKVELTGDITAIFTNTFVEEYYNE